MHPTRHRLDLRTTRIAVIDAGTHALRCLVAEVFPDGRYRFVDDLRIPTGLGKGLAVSGVIDEDARRVLFDSLRTLLCLVRAHAPSVVSLSATSAFRKAHNGRCIVEEIGQIFGIPSVILPADEEARLAYDAAGTSLGLASRSYGFIDVGGGSVQFLARRGHELACFGSTDIGAVYLTELFKKSDPLSQRERDAMESHVRLALTSALAPCPNRRVPLVAGAGGTLATMAAVHLRQSGSSRNVHGYALSFESFSNLARDLIQKSIPELRSTPGIPPDRAPYVAAGACVARQTLERLGAKEIVFTETGLREGLLICLIRDLLGVHPHPWQRPASDLNDK